MAYSQSNYEGDGLTTQFNFGFDYIEKAHVRVMVNGEVVTDWEWVSPSTIRFFTAPAVGAVVVIGRYTSRAQRLVDYAVPSSLNEQDLDADSLQAFYMAQEAIDTADSAMITDIASGHFTAQNRRVTNMEDPVAPQDAVTKNYVDTASTSQVNQANAARAAAEAAQRTAEANATLSGTNAGVTTVKAAEGLQSAANAKTSETNSKTSETNAKTSETNARASEAVAKSAEANAKTSETNSKTSETITKTAEAATKTMEANVLALEKRARDAAASASAFAAPLGFTFWWQGKRSAIPDGFTPLDGQIGVIEDHEAMWELANGGAFEVITNAAWLASPYLRGKFATGADELTFRFPDMNGVQEGSLKGLFARGDGIGGAIGDLLGDAVRNVTGSSLYRWGAELGGTGPFWSSNATGTSGDEVVVTAGSNPRRAINFDLSRSTPTAAEVRPVSAIGVWIMRTRGSTFVLEGSKAATLGANVFSGTQAFNAGFTIMGATDQVVRTDVFQSLTDFQKSQARTNIGLGQVQPFGNGIRMRSPNNREDLRVQDDGVWGSFSDGLSGWRPLGVGQGGTGANNAASARGNLGLGNLATQNMTGNTEHVFMGSGYHTFRDICSVLLRHNQLGSLCFACTAQGGYSPSMLISGGGLRAAGISWDGNGGALGGSMTPGGYYTGTWMAMGYADGRAGSREGSTLWLKIGH